MKTIVVSNMIKTFPNLKEIEDSKGKRRIDFSQEMEEEVYIHGKIFLLVEHYWVCRKYVYYVYGV